MIKKKRYCGNGKCLEGKILRFNFFKLNELDVGEKNASKCSIGHGRKVVDFEEVCLEVQFPGTVAGGGK